MIVQFLSQLCQLRIHSKQAKNKLTHLDLFFGMINIRRFFLEFSRDCFEFLRYVMDPGAEILFNFSGFLNLSLFRKNLENIENLSTNPT